MRLWKRFQWVALAAFFVCGAQAQDLGNVGLRTVSQDIFDGASCASAPLTQTVNNIGQNVHYFIYETSGTVSAISVEIEGRNDDSQSWQRISPGVATNTSSGGVFANIYLNFIRIAVTSCTGTGTITGTYSGTSVAATPDAPFFFTGQGSITSCPNQANVSFTAGGSGSTRIITSAGSGERIFLCHLSLSLSSAVTVTIEQGTGTNCGTNTTDLATYPNLSTIALDFGTASALQVAADSDLCVNVSGASTVGGVAIYAEF